MSTLIAPPAPFGLLERDDLLRHLGHFLANAEAGLGRLVFVAGEAGVGKSALLRHFAAKLAPRHRVLRGFCDPLSTPRALGPLFDLDDPVLTRLLLEEAPRELIFRQVRGRLESCDSSDVLIIEDAHWADEATLDLLRFLGRRIGRTKSLVLVSYRDDELGAHHPLRQSIGDLANCEGVHRLIVPPLSREAVVELAAPSGLDADRLYARTAGNPFFVTEILEAHGDVSPSVRDVVLARAARLPPAAWSILEAAAVLGSPCDRDVLDLTIEREAGALEACLDRGMLYQEGPRISFRHELAREAIASIIPPSRTIALHQTALWLFSMLPALQQNPARLAYHADMAGDSGAVLHYAQIAAQNADRLGAHREAAEHYERALRHATPLPTQERARLWESLANAYYLTARIDGASKAASNALNIAIDDADLMREGNVRSLLSRIHWAAGRFADAELEAEQAALGLESAGDEPGLAAALAALARLNVANQQIDRATACSERAVAVATATGCAETLADALLTLGESKLDRGHLARGKQDIDRAQRLATRHGLDHVMARGFICLGHGLSNAGHPHDALCHYQLGVDYCAVRDFDLPRMHLTALIACELLTMGRWDESLEQARVVLLAREAAPASRFFAQIVASVIQVRRGNREFPALLDAALDLANVSRCPSYLIAVHAARAEAAHLIGDDARAAAEAATALAFPGVPGHPANSGELAYWLWKSGAIPSHARASSPYTDQIAGQWSDAAEAWEARGAPYEAARARAESADEAALRQALATFEHLGAEPEASQVRRRLRRLGAARIPRGPRPSTRTHPAGFTRREADVAALLGESLTTPRIAERLYLSPRTVEKHVASIVAKLGVTNRAAAAELLRKQSTPPQSG